MEKGEFQT